MDLLNNFLIKMKDNFNIEELIKSIYENMQHKSYHNRLHYKKYENSLIQLFSESSQEYTKWDIYNICRSIIFSSSTGKIVSYSHSNIKYLTYDDFKTLNINQDTIFTESHEGTLISVFFYNDKWYYATRREIDMYKTHRYILGDKSKLSHGEMFDECLTKCGLTKEQFEEKLDKSYQYHFELVHYDNKINMSYDIRFGENYTKLYLLFIRDVNNEIIDKQSINNMSDNLNITMSSEISYNELMDIMRTDNLLEIEGYMFNRTNENGNIELCKVLHNNYNNKIRYNPGYKTHQELCLYLYQKNLLSDDKISMNYKIYKNQGNNEFGSVETIGLLNAVITYIGQRMLDIYYKFNNNSMIHKNEEIFKNLFIDNKEYNIIFYTLGKMKGIHKNRQVTINEMRKFLKYNMSASDVWKLGNTIKKFELNENILMTYPVKIVNLFWEP